MSLLLAVVLLYMWGNYIRVSLDETADGDMVIWYGRTHRKFFVIKFNKKE